MVTDRSDTRISARLRIVDEHVRMENQHDLDGIMGTFGETARYDDEPSGAHYTGRDQVHTFYAELLLALPDLQIEIVKRHACEDAIVLEAAITGHHMGTWRGLPATGWRIQFPLCAIFTFDAADRLAGEKIYYEVPPHSFGRSKTFMPRFRALG